MTFLLEIIGFVIVILLLAFMTDPEHAGDNIGKFLNSINEATHAR